MQHTEIERRDPIPTLGIVGRATISGGESEGKPSADATRSGEANVTCAPPSPRVLLRLLLRWKAPWPEAQPAPSSGSDWEPASGEWRVPSVCRACAGVWRVASAEWRVTWHTVATVA